MGCSKFENLNVKCLLPNLGERPESPTWSEPLRSSLSEHRRNGNNAETEQRGSGTGSLFPERGFERNGNGAERERPGTGTGTGTGTGNGAERRERERCSRRNGRKRERNGIARNGNGGERERRQNGNGGRSGTGTAAEQWNGRENGTAENARGWNGRERERQRNGNGVPPGTAAERERRQKRDSERLNASNACDPSCPYGHEGRYLRYFRARGAGAGGRLPRCAQRREGRF